MENFLDIINSKIDILDSDIEDILYSEVLNTLSKIKKEFRTNSGKNLQEYFDKLKSVQKTQNDFVTYLSSYKKEEVSDTNVNIDLDESISVSSQAVEELPKKEIEKINPFATIPEDSYYFHNFNDDYAEENGKLTVEYSLTPIKDFKLFLLKIVGIKLFDNIFFGRTIRDCMKKMFKFLFALNETPFISLCEQNTKFFSQSASEMKKPVVLKENKCYFESDIDENQAHEMVLNLLNHINIDLNACKILLHSSSTKNNEHYITFVF